jgi:predicted DNA-binding protein with PD1-like motif
MALFKKVESKELFMGRLDHGVDLLEEITDICQKNNIQLGRVEAIGAVQKARLAFYDQQTFEYQFFTIDKPLEIVKLMGNISLKDGNPFVHAHIALADKNGAVYGGHLASGTIIFACEIIIESMVGASFERKYDEETHLPLWAMME